MCTYTKVNYAITRIHEKAVRSDLPKRMKKSLHYQITYYQLLFQCYLLVLGSFVKLISFFYVFYFFFCVKYS